MRQSPLIGEGVRAAREFAQALRERPMRLALALSVIAHGAFLLTLSRGDLFRVERMEPLLRAHLLEQARDTSAVLPPPAAKTPAPSSKPAPVRPHSVRPELPELPELSAMASSPAPRTPESLTGQETAALSAASEMLPPGPASQVGDQEPVSPLVEGTAELSAAQTSQPPVEAAGAAPAGTVGGFGSPEVAAAPSPGDLAALRRRIDARKVYPRLAVRNGWEGRVLVEMRLEGDGRLAAVRLLRGSGYTVLDEATLAAVRSAAPFPPVACVVAVPVEFRLVP